jgi:hypothetical protein
MPLGICVPHYAMYHSQFCYARYLKLRQEEEKIGKDNHPAITKGKMLNQYRRTIILRVLHLIFLEIDGSEADINHTFGTLQTPLKAP